MHLILACRTFCSDVADHYKASESCFEKYKITGKWLGAHGNEDGRREREKMGSISIFNFAHLEPSSEYLFTHSKLSVLEYGIHAIDN